MKLVKLCYYAHGWHLAITNDALLDEAVEAWKFGPVVPSVYHAFKEFGAFAITKRATVIEPSLSSGFRIVTPELNLTEFLAQRASRVIEKVWEKYSPLSATSLSNLSHVEGSPWKVTYDPNVRNKDIPNDVIKKYFMELGSQHGVVAHA